MMAWMKSLSWWQATPRPWEAIFSSALSPSSFALWRSCFMISIAFFVLGFKSVKTKAKKLRNCFGCNVCLSRNLVINKKSRCRGLSRQTELLITPYSLEPVLRGHHSRGWPLNTRLTVVLLIISNARLIFFSLTFLLTDIVLNVITANTPTSSALMLHLTWC